LTRASLGASSGIGVVAVGGYGRGELSPHSDIDLLFVLEGKVDVTAATLRGMLYPLWDAGFQVGHAARSAKETVERAGQDLDGATAILSARLIAGDPAPFQELIDRRARWIRKEGKRLARRIVDATAERHRAADRAGWSLAPDLKEDAGGLRDVHALGWLAVVTGEDPAGSDIAAAADTLLAAREGLHAVSKRKLDTLRIDLQPGVAHFLGLDGDDGADELMSEVHSAGRVIEHAGASERDRLAQRLVGGPKRSGSVRVLAPGVRLHDGVISADAPAPSESNAWALAALAAQAATGRPIDAPTLTWMKAGFSTIAATEAWDDGTRDSFFELLAGPHASAALESMDHTGAWRALLPEWLGVRGRAQHDPYHRYTVDAHSFLAVEEVGRAISTDPLAREAATEAGDLRTLLLAALLHDVGKGSGEDHSVAGARLAEVACKRIGLSTEETSEVVGLVRHHLLLVDTATRRDLDDADVVEKVAAIVGEQRRLGLLLILSIADGRATGPEGWTEWKNALVSDLYRKALITFETGSPPPPSDVMGKVRAVEAIAPELGGRAHALIEAMPRSYLESVPPPEMADDVRMLLNPPAPGEIRHRVDAGDASGRATITVCVVDRPGTLARSAGVLALHRIAVRRAQAYSTASGLALERFVVDAPSRAAIDAFVSDLAGAYAGKLSVDARLARKVSDYRPSAPVTPDVRVLDDASEHSTVVEVRAPDALGLLYAITSGLSDLDLDIHVAKIDTLGSRVVDVFYVRTSWGTKLGPEQSAEVARSIEHRVARLFV
jgi:[protein-PII] uridylyltransferase